MLIEEKNVTESATYGKCCLDELQREIYVLNVEPRKE